MAWEKEKSSNLKSIIEHKLQLSLLPTSPLPATVHATGATLIKPSTLLLIELSNPLADARWHKFNFSSSGDPCLHGSLSSIEAEYSKHGWNQKHVSE